MLEEDLAWDRWWCNWHCKLKWCLACSVVRQIKWTWKAQIPKNICQRDRDQPVWREELDALLLGRLEHAKSILLARGRRWVVQGASRAKLAPADFECNLGQRKRRLHQAAGQLGEVPSPLSCQVPYEPKWTGEFRIAWHLPRCHKSQVLAQLSVLAPKWVDEDHLAAADLWKLHGPVVAVDTLASQEWRQLGLPQHK